MTDIHTLSKIELPCLAVLDSLFHEHVMATNVVNILSRPFWNFRKWREIVIFVPRQQASVQSAKLQSNANLCAYTRSSITIQNTDDQDDFYGWILGWINLIFSGLAFIAKQIFWEFCQQIKNVSNATNAIWNHFISHWYRYIQCNLVIWKES